MSLSGTGRLVEGSGTLHSRRSARSGPFTSYKHSTPLEPVSQHAAT